MREPSPAWGQAADDPQSVAAREAPVWEKKHAPRAEPGFFGAPGDLPPRGQAGQGPAGQGQADHSLPESSSEAERGEPGTTVDKLALIGTVSHWPRFCPVQNTPGFQAT